MEAAAHLFVLKMNSSHSIVQVLFVVCMYCGPLLMFCVLYQLYIYVQMLLGTFTCTAIPGEFVWLPGLLTKVGISACVCFMRKTHLPYMNR